MVEQEEDEEDEDYTENIEDKLLQQSSNNKTDIVMLKK